MFSYIYRFHTIRKYSLLWLHEFGAGASAGTVMTVFWFDMHTILALWGFDTLRPRQDGRNFTDDIFKCIFFKVNFWLLIEISLKFVSRGPMNNTSATLWNNRYITIQNVPYEWVSWQTKGIQYVNDILNENGDFLSHTEISEKFGVRCHFLQALQIRQSLPLEWRRVIRSEYSYKPVREPFIYHNGAVSQLDKCATKFIYECYVQMKYATPRVYWNGKRYM